MVLEVGHGSETHGIPEKAAFALATGIPPFFLSTPTDPTYGDAGVSIDFSILVRDPDNDPLTVTWDWGDGSVSTNVTSPALPPTIVLSNHTYNPVPIPGRGDYTVDYTLNITLDDGNGNTVWDLTTIVVKLPRNGIPSIINILLSPSPPKVRVNPGDEVTIIANASDPEGEPLTWTFRFNNSVEEYLVVVDHTDWTAPGAVVWSNITSVFAAVGSYAIYLNVSDAPPPYDIGAHNVSQAPLDVEVVPNAPPQSLSSILVEPGEPVVRSEIGYVLVNYSIQAFDEDGDILSATWDFGDGSSPVVEASPGGSGLYKFIQQQNYSDVRDFNVSVTITDGHPGHEIFLYTLVHVNSTNLPPSLSLDYKLSKGAYAVKNELLNFTLVISDLERDPIEVIIDFGDNSSRLYFNLTDFVGNNVTIGFNHSYANLGNFSMTIWYTDNKVGLFNHYKHTNVTIDVQAIPEVVHNIWSWWDYTSLGLVCMIPVLLVVRFIQVSHRRKIIEEEGMTYDEWKLLKSVEAEESPKNKEGGP